MSISPIATSPNARPERPQDARIGDATLDYKAFLKLLVSQLQNQDPLEPMKSSDYVAQLATFSQVERTMESNERLNSILESSRIDQASSLVGKKVRSADGQTAGVVVTATIGPDGVFVQLDSGAELRVDRSITIGVGQ